MRILIVVHGYPPTFTGGAELRAERTARGLTAHGHEVAVLCVESLSTQSGKPEEHELMQDGVLVHRIHFRFDSGLDGFRQQYDNPHMAAALERMIRFWRPDLIHLFSGYLSGMGAIHTAVAHRTPIFVSLTDYWWLCHRIILVRTDGTRCDGPTPIGCARCHWEMYRRFRIPRQVVRPLADNFWQLAERSPQLAQALGVDQQAERQQSLLAALANANALIAPSRYLADVYIQHGIDPALIHVLRQGVDLALCPVRPRSTALRFGYFGQLKFHKGIHILVEAWGLLCGARERSLVLYGSDRGEEKFVAHLRESSQSLPGIRWEPPVPHAEIWQALAQIDVLVIPSRWIENSPNIILEAQAMGVIIIGTNLGGIAELVHHGQNGLVFEPDDAADLAAQMQRILDEPELLAELRRHPIRFGTFAEELDRLEALYRAHTESARRMAPPDPAPPALLEDENLSRAAIDDDP